MGCLLTVFALVGATRAMRSNDHARANIMFRRRIYAQAFTIAAIVVGSSYWQKDREKRKEFDAVEKERLRIEKREKWLAELEARDEEDRDFKEYMGRRRGEHLGTAVAALDSENVRKGRPSRKDAAKEGGEFVDEADSAKRGRKGGAIVGSVRDLVEGKK
jgi:hypothetical protein